MKSIIFIFTSLFSVSIYSNTLSPPELLQRDLGESIEFISNTEIRYCPDNTCAIYKSTKNHIHLATYVYLHLFHKSSYIYLNKNFSGNKAFRSLAKEEPAITKSVENICKSKNKTITCILLSIEQKSGIKQCSGRYDEGHFCYGCETNENICKKL